MTGRRVPPHHDPACWGCGENATGLRLPPPPEEGLTEYEAYVVFDERHQGGPGLEVATVGGGTGLPYAGTWLGLMGCSGPGKVYRFAQIVAAATLALELSASAAMATAGSENFFRAHHERGGLR